MARVHAGQRWWRRPAWMAGLAVVAMLSGIGVAASPAAAAPTAPGATGPTSATWCSEHGASLAAWAPTTPPLPICGPGPAYGGTWSTVTIPGPYGAMNRYYNATPGFQCVELSDRFLAVVDGFGAVMGNGSEVVMNFHAAYPQTSVIVNGTSGAVGHPPEAGDVLSFSSTPSFYDPSDGHTAIVVGSNVNPRTGNGTVHIAQENVSPGDYLYTLDLVQWRLVDPNEAPDAEFQYPYGEWLAVPSARPSASTGVPQLLSTTTAGPSSKVVHRAVIGHHRRAKARPDKVTPVAKAQPAKAKPAKVVPTTALPKKPRPATSRPARALRHRMRRLARLISGSGQASRSGAGLFS